MTELNNRKKTVVVAIAAVSGGGKTTVINELRSRLTSSEAIYFDDYDFEESPEDYCQWVENGADYNAWNLEKFTKDIVSLLTKANIEYILLDYPFSYMNDTVKPYIDYSVFIDTPLDIAMARRILRDKLNQPLSLLKDDLDGYLSGGRIAYLEMLRTIKPNSDFIVDGSLGIEKITNQIIEEISKLKL